MIEKKYPVPQKFSTIHGYPFGPALSHSIVLETFRSQGWKVPPDYLEFLLEWNGFGFDGFQCESLVFPMAQTRSTELVQAHWPPQLPFDFRKQPLKVATVQGFLGIFTENPHLDVLNRQQSDYFRALVPPEFIRIGYGNFDDSIVIAVSGEHFGRVFYYIGPGVIGVDTPCSIDNLDFVADTFKAFWSSIITVAIEQMAVE